MTSRDFCYWLQGLFELANPQQLDVHQTRLIREHLTLAFKHDIDQRYPEHQRAALDAVHDGSTVPTMWDIDQQYLSPFIKC